MKQKQRIRELRHEEFLPANHANSANGDRAPSLQAHTRKGERRSPGRQEWYTLLAGSFLLLFICPADPTHSPRASYRINDMITDPVCMFGSNFTPAHRL